MEEEEGDDEDDSWEKNSTLSAADTKFDFAEKLLSFRTEIRKDEVWLQAKSLDTKKKESSEEVKFLDSILLEVGKCIKKIVSAEKPKKKEDVRNALVMAAENIVKLNKLRALTRRT